MEINMWLSRPTCKRRDTFFPSHSIKVSDVRRFAKGLVYCVTGFRTLYWLLIVLLYYYKCTVRYRRDFENLTTLRHIAFKCVFIIFRYGGGNVLITWSLSWFQYYWKFKLLHFPFMWPCCIVTNFFIIKPTRCTCFSLSASQPIVGLYSQPFSGLLAFSFEVSRSHTTTRHSR